MTHEFCPGRPPAFGNACRLNGVVVVGTERKELRCKGAAYRHSARVRFLPIASKLKVIARCVQHLPCLFGGRTDEPVKEPRLGPVAAHPGSGQRG